MLSKIAKAVWELFEEWGEIRYEQYKKHNFEAWY
jgi:hypothetical protein